MTSSSVERCDWPVGRSVPDLEHGVPGPGSHGGSVLRHAETADAIVVPGQHACAARNSRSHHVQRKLRKTVTTRTDAQANSNVSFMRTCDCSISRTFQRSAHFFPHKLTFSTSILILSVFLLPIFGRCLSFYSCVFTVTILYPRAVVGAKTVSLSVRHIAYFTVHFCILCK